MAALSLVLQDNGGTLDGGQDTSPPTAFTITVVGVDDPRQQLVGPREPRLGVGERPFQVTQQHMLTDNRNPAQVCRQHSLEFNALAVCIGGKQAKTFHKWACSDNTR